MNLVIVDDEPVICQGLAVLIEKNDWGWNVYGVFSDAEEALETCDWDQVQVVLMDIHMPNIDGLSLVHALRERGYETDAVFITAYAKFDYAQRAVSEHALDYLLKPVSKTNLERALQKAADAYKKRIEKEEDPAYVKENLVYLRKTLFSDIMFEERKITEQEMKKKQKQYFLEDKRYGLFCFISTRTKQELKSLLNRECSKKIDWYIYGHEYCFIILFLYSDGGEKEVSGVIDKFEKIRGSYYLSVTNMEELPDVYQRLLIRIRGFYHDVPEKKNAELIKNNIVLDTKNLSMPVQQAVKFIDGNLGKPLSLQLIAREVYLHPTYLSNIFKKQTGYTVTSYINQRRIYEAQKLLKDPRNRICWVMGQVGFVNQRYFGKLFKEMVGMTPSNYKMEIFMRNRERND